MGAPKSKNSCQSLSSTTVPANTGTMIDRPIKMPAMKLPASRNSNREFFTIHFEPDVIAARLRPSSPKPMAGQGHRRLNQINRAI